MLEASIPFAPSWLTDMCKGFQGKADEPNTRPRDSSYETDKAVRKRIIRFLTEDAQHSVEGAGGDHTAFVTAAYCRDQGAGPDETFELMLEFWNENCQPPWSEGNLETKVANAYLYASNTAGNRDPALDFENLDNDQPQPDVSEFFDTDGDEPGTDTSDEEFNALFGTLGARLNERYCVVWIGDSLRIADDTGSQIRMLRIEAFHQLLKAQKVRKGDGNLAQASNEWMGWSGRRTYPGGLVFEPGRQKTGNALNMWRGFELQPTVSGDRVNEAAKDAVKMWVEHVYENVAQGSQACGDWVLTYFAQLIQKPEVKPGVALVLKGKKGVGKNALFDPLISILGNHGLVADDRRYVTGQFNAHLERLLLIVLDEAFWSGDKGAEGKLKGLITGKDHTIERKGLDPFSVRNLTRVGIIGNEKWLVPASTDERRYMILEVGRDRMQDRPWFAKMMNGFVDADALGLRFLMQYLGAHDLQVADVGQALDTDMLSDQKAHSLNNIGQWWMECLSEGRLCGLDALGGLDDTDPDWPSSVEIAELSDAFMRWVKRVDRKEYRFSSQEITQDLREYGAIGSTRRKSIKEGRKRFVDLKPWAECRAVFSAITGISLEENDENSEFFE